MKLSDYIDTLLGRKIEVVGMGVSNLPLIRLLLKNGCCVTVRDRASRGQLPAGDEIEALGATLILGDGYLDGLDGDVIFRAPGIRPDLPAFAKAVARGAVLTSEMEAFFEVCPAKILAVTGSDGKTTTATIMAELLKAAGYRVHLGGNIGRPLLCGAEQMSREDLVVLELSSFQLMTMKSSPEIAVVTNVAPNHLDIHLDMAEYIDAKKNIFRYQKAENKLVLNLDNPITASFAEEAQGRTAFFSTKRPVENGACLSEGIICALTNGVSRPIMYASDIRLPGAHNIENYLAAFAATEGLLSPEIQRQIATTFEGVEHRIELVRHHRGVAYYNDSIASSPTRAIACLRSFEGRVILIAGGKDKGVPFDELGREIADRVKTLVVTGSAAEQIADAVLRAPDYTGVPQILREPNFKDAVLAASNAAEAGDTVILSPACTSFDQFKNFAERGEQFKEIVNTLK